jgi:hypothetical protein
MIDGITKSFNYRLMESKEIPASGRDKWKYFIVIRLRGVFVAWDTGEQ